MADRIENRSEHRMNVTLPVSFRRLDKHVDQQPEYEGVVENISNGGVYFCCTNCKALDLRLEHRLDITIKIPSGSGNWRPDRILKAQGMVTRVHNSFDNPHFLGVALKFQNGLDSIIFC